MATAEGHVALWATPREGIEIVATAEGHVALWTTPPKGIEVVATAEGHVACSGYMDF